MAHWPIMKSIAGFIIPKFEGCIVEIGAGHSSRILNELAVQFKRDFYSCDVIDRTKGKLSLFHHQKIMKSVEFMEEWDSYNEKPTIVFIDGTHKYDTTKEEFWFFYERMVPGGAMFMHDMLPASDGYIKRGCGDVYKLRLELEKDSNIEILTFPHATVEFGMSVVFKKHRYNNYSPPGEHYDY